MPGAFRSNLQADAPAIRRLRKTSVCDAAACWLGRVRLSVGPASQTAARRTQPPLLPRAAPSVTCGALQRLVRDRPFGAPRNHPASPAGLMLAAWHAFTPTTGSSGTSPEVSSPSAHSGHHALFRPSHRPDDPASASVRPCGFTPGRGSCVAQSHTGECRDVPLPTDVMRGLAEDKAHRTCRFSPAAPLGFTLRSFLPPGRACGTFPSFVSHLPFCLQPSSRSFSPGISRCETFFFASMRLANLSPTANGQSRTLSIGFWEFSRRAIRLSRQPPKSAGAMLPWVFHAPAA